MPIQKPSLSVSIFQLIQTLHFPYLTMEAPGGGKRKGGEINKQYNVLDYMERSNWQCFYHNHGSSFKKLHAAHNNSFYFIFYSYVVPIIYIQ